MNMEKELKEWRIIEEAPKYEVSNYGDVRNIKTKRLIVGSIDKDGYPRVMLSLGGGKKITRFRHRLAALAFLPNPNNFPQINHKDENKGNPYVGSISHNYQDGNLEWCSISYNVRYGKGAESRREKLKNNYRLRKNPNRHSVVTYVYDFKTHEFLGKYDSVTEAVKAFNADYRTVYRMVHQIAPIQRQHAGRIYSSEALSFDN